MKTHPRSQLAPHANTKVVVLHGKSIQTLDDFYKDLQQALEIPAYFGHNLDALEEVLSDLTWNKSPHIIVIIYRSELLLNNYPEERESLMAVLTECDNPVLDILFL